MVPLLPPLGLVHADLGEAPSLEGVVAPALL